MNPHIAIQTSTVTFAYLLLLFVGGWMAIKEREREKEREKRTFQRNH